MGFPPPLLVAWPGPGTVVTAASVFALLVAAPVPWLVCSFGIAPIGNITKPNKYHGHNSADSRFAVAQAWAESCR